MESSNHDRLSAYDFVATVLWIGFLLAISFMEAPLRFQAKSITVPLALEIGRLVFHALNGCEILLAAWIQTCQFWNGPSMRSKYLFRIAASILIAQTTILFLFLDPRTEAIILNQEVEESSYHSIYIILEVLKLLTLAFLAHSQIRDFKSKIRAN